GEPAPPRGCASAVSALRAAGSAADRDAHPLDRVVRVAAEVPGWLVGLLVAERIAGAAAELVPSRGCLPPEGPPAPGPWRVDVALDVGRGPAATRVGRHLDRDDLPPSRPRPAVQHARPRGERAGARRKVRDSGRCQEGAREHAAERDSLLTLVVAEAV